MKYGLRKPGLAAPSLRYKLTVNRQGRTERGVRRGKAASYSISSTAIVDLPFD